MTGATRWLVQLAAAGTLCALTCAAIAQTPTDPDEVATDPDGKPLDLETLLVPVPEAPETRTPKEDIRRLLRPELSILDARSRLDKDISERSDELARLRIQERALQGDLNKMTTRFEALTEGRDTERDVVRRRLRTMLRIKRKASSSLLFESASYGAFSDREEARQRLYEADRRRVIRYREQLDEWRFSKRDLARRTENLANTRQTIAFLEQVLAWDKEEQQALKFAVIGQPEFYAEYIKEMEGLNAYVRDAVQAATDPSRAQLYMEQNKGGLASPVRNADIKGRFGVRTHPTFRIDGNYRGIHMVPFRPTGWDEVRSIYWGYVGYTGWMRGLGRVVIIDHTLGYTSVYAHLRRIDVKVGDKVKTGQALGTMGETGSFWGRWLYLEMRKDGQPLNPARWIR